MRSAFCLFGKIGGTQGKDGIGDPIDIKVCYDSYKEHIIDVNNCDVFLHSWSNEFTNQLLAFYKPKGFIIEPQIDFSLISEKWENKEGCFRAYSRWYSTKKVIELKQEYEKRNNFKYDWVMLCRFDLLFFVDLVFEKLNPKYFHAPVWNAPPLERKKKTEPDRVNRSEKKEGLSDLFFIANSEMMDKFSTVYDYLDEYIPSQHYAAWRQVKEVIGNPQEVVKFILYRWFDFELYRFKVCNHFE